MTKERIGIIGGTGDQGKGLALQWARAGYEIIIGSRDPAKAQAAAAEIASITGPTRNVSGASNAAAAQDSGIVVLTVPVAAQIATLKDIREHLKAGTLLVDVTVPLEPAIGGRPGRMLGIWAGSAAEQCAELAPPGVEVISAFHNVSASLLADLGHSVECDVLVCGDSKASKERLKELVDVIDGCRFVDAGPLSNSRTVEAMTALLIGINIRYKTHAGVRITGV
jgi:8-hydroxy-5-deazaflavin:NADPH oxidoreductase